VPAAAPAPAVELTCSASGGPRAHGRARLQGPAELACRAGGGAHSHGRRWISLARPAAELACRDDGGARSHGAYDGASSMGTDGKRRKKEMCGNFTLS
jgi:hypothetical protein